AMYLPHWLSHRAVSGKRSSIQRKSLVILRAFRYFDSVSSPMRTMVSLKYLYVGTTRLSGAGTPLYTRPARSNFDWWHGQKKPPNQSPPRSAGAISGRNVGEHPRCVQMPTATQSSALIDRYSFLQSFGCCESFDFGSSSRGSSFGRLASICGVRLTSHTTLPRHSTSIFCPASILLTSTSTGAPAAFARSLGHIDITNGTAVATMPMPPTTLVATTRKRRLSASTSAGSVALLGVPAGSAIVAYASFSVNTPRIAHCSQKPIDYTGFDDRAGSSAPACRLNHA